MRHDGRDIYHPAIPAALHMRHERAAHQKHTGEVDREHAVPFGERVVDAQFPDVDAGVIDEDIGWAEFGFHLPLELAREGITVVAISPGPFATEMTEAIINDPQKSEQFMSHTPMRRWGDPKDVGKLALFLCSEDASFITGTDILIDGGWCAE